MVRDQTIYTQAMPFFFDGGGYPFSRRAGTAVLSDSLQTSYEKLRAIRVKLRSGLDACSWQGLSPID